MFKFFVWDKIKVILITITDDISVFVHADLKAIKAFDPLKKVSVLHLLQFFAERRVKVDVLV